MDIVVRVCWPGGTSFDGCIRTHHPCPNRSNGCLPTPNGSSVTLRWKRNRHQSDPTHQNPHTPTQSNNKIGEIAGIHAHPPDIQRQLQDSQGKSYSAPFFFLPRLRASPRRGIDPTRHTRVTPWWAYGCRPFLHTTHKRPKTKIRYGAAQNRTCCSPIATANSGGARGERMMARAAAVWPATGA